MMERKLMVFKRSTGCFARVAVVSGAAWLMGGVSLLGQAVPRYQSPIMAPAAPAVPALPTPPAVTPNGTVVEDVVVRVNDQIISRSDVERSEEQLAQEDRQSNATPAEAAERQKNMLRDMIDQQLLLSRGKELGINADAEVIRRLDEIRKQNKIDSMEDLEKAVRAQGLSYEDFKAKIRNDIIVQQVVRDEVGRRLQMTQAQEQAYYDAHKQEFEQPEQIRLAEILIPTAADATDAQVAQAQAKADDVAAKLKAGAKFEDLAKQYSGGSTAAQGGELGSFKRGGLAKVLEDQTYPLAVGESTAPIRTRQGFVILKVLEHQKAGIPPMKDVEPEIQQALYTQQMQPAIRAYLTKLREDAYVDIRPGFVDSGASPKQTKPIFSAYAPPTPKKKKNQQVTRYGTSGFQRAAVGANSGGSDAALPPEPAAVPAATKPAAVSDAERTSLASNGAGAGSSASSASSASSSSSAAGNEVAANTTGRMSRTVSAKKVKEKKIRREKVRFGQAPREALPAAPVTEVASTPQTATPGAAAGALPQASTTAPEVANAEDPLAPAAPKLKKTRFSAEAPQFKLRKAKVKQAKVTEKVKATPVAMTSEEAATMKTQAAPLGLNGDTTKKKKKRKKGDPKERLQDKTPVKTDKFANPTGPGTTNDLSKTPVGGVAPTADRTTLPPANAPAPGQAVPPSVPGSTTPAPGSAVPAGVPPTL
jgi:peptidyl-prolyl cis-trans isomerase SurA